MSKQWERLHSDSREAALFCVFSCRGRKVQGQNCVGRPHSSAAHQTNGVFHLYFTPSLAAERVTGHESAVIMVSYCICTSHSFRFFVLFFFHMNVPTGETIVLECSLWCNGLTVLQQRVNSALSLLEYGRNNRITLHIKVRKLFSYW